MNKYKLNSRITGMHCLKCGAKYEVGDYFYGCPACLEQGENAAMTFDYEGDVEIDTNALGWQRYAKMLPYNKTISLGEGNTPVLFLERMTKDMDIGALYSKNEFQNPTGSHKDRMNPFITARAVSCGYEAVTCASSGNEAASLAAYAAAEGLRCINVSTSSIPKLWKQASDATGAELVLVPTSADRLTYQRENMGVQWYPATNLLDIPIASCPYGIQGYKIISFELFDYFGKKLPDYILIPSCRGDLLYGIYEGFSDLKRYGYIEQLPHLVACEPNPRLELVLAGHKHTEKFAGDTSKTSSIGGATTTWQAEYALRNSDGFAISVSQEEAVASIAEMAHYGLYLESSSSIVFPCLKKALAEGKINRDKTVLFILTSNGYKNE